jgi:serine phosphatase RsbU (regulator of sigma subunit)/putative methionine-R-sulfoxide reductase with GAF domain
MKKSTLPKISRWNQVIDLGSQLLEVNNLAAQRDLIISALQNLFGGHNEVWVNETLFRLPGRHFQPINSSDSLTTEMDQAKSTGELIQTCEQEHRLAMPIISQDTTFGVMQVSRSNENPFKEEEIEVFRGMAAHIALVLTNTLRIAVEQWRIEQLNLVRKVSAQIVDILDLDELVRRLTQLIQQTFQYYYVAIFTLEPTQKILKFRSSAGQVGFKRKRRSSPVLEVEVGQGLIGLVALTGEEIISNDIHKEPRFKFIASLPETMSEVVLPLKIEDKILGVLDIQSNEATAFHPNDLLVLRALAANISIAVEGAHLYGDLQKHAHHLALVAEVSRDITSILDLGELLRKVAALIQERLGYPHVHLFSVHPNRRRIYHEAGSGWRGSALEGYSLDLDSPIGLIPWVASHGQTMVANDVSIEPRYKPSALPPENTLAELVIPLIYDGQVLGVLDIQAEKTDVFTEDDRFICEALADNIATAIHNADLYQSEKWRRQIADSLREVAGLLSANVSVDDVLDTILGELEKDLPCEVSAIWLLDGEDIYLGHIRGADPIDVELARKDWPESSNFLVEALNSDLPIIRKPIDPIGPSGAARGYSADYSSIAVRLQIGNQPLGVLTLAHPTSGRYGHEAQEITSTFAGYAAVAIENARLFDAAQEQAYASAALLQVAQTVANADNLDDLLASIARITPILVGVESCAIYLYQDEIFLSSHAYGMTDDIQKIITGKNFSAGDYPLLDTVLECNQLVIGSLKSNSPEAWLCPDLALSKEDSFYAMEMGEKLLIGFPLMIKAEFFGVMVIEETSEARRFRQKRIEIISGIAQQLAMSIQNEHLQLETVARERLEYEFHLARQIQQTFLPEQLPEFENWGLAAYWRPARQVGGDFYDVFQLPGGQLGLIIADVSDKGIPAALFMAVTRTLLRAVILEISSPAAVLQRINDLLIPENQQGMFVTTVYAVLSLKTGELTYANAGHNPPFLICTEEQKIESLNRTGMALGIVENAKIEERVVHLNTGDCLLLYTDGLTEAVSQQQDLFGDERLQAVFKVHHQSPAEKIVKSIEESVFGFMGTNLPIDDLTMLVLQRLQ